MKKRLILAFSLMVAIITMTAAFIPSDVNKGDVLQANLKHPEAGYVESIGN